MNVGQSSPIYSQFKLMSLSHQGTTRATSLTLQPQKQAHGKLIGRTVDNFLMHLSTWPYPVIPPLLFNTARGLEMLMENETEEEF